MSLMISGRLPTVPEYYREFINPEVDLTERPKQCCPFHKEDTPSFSYDLRTGKWSCFGSCHAYGKDVIEMHMRWGRFNSRAEASQDLVRKYNIPIDKTYTKKEDVLLNMHKIDGIVLQAQAKRLANNPYRWIELDEVMSEYPVDNDKLYNLVIEWSNQR